MREAGWLEWSSFGVLVAALLVIDIAYASRGERGRSVRKAWTWSLIWIGVSLAFGAWIALRLGSEAGLAYLTAYVLEKSLSIDNLAVFAVVFAQTGVPPALQSRALVWGVLGALVMRALLIAVGIYVLERFHWLVYPFGALLAYAAVQTLRGEAGKRPWVEATCALCSSWISRFVPIVGQLHGERFIARIDGKRFATPLLVALIAIESADLVFAVDSIPAVLAVTRDPFLVYSSNIFALLGLRALYGVVGDLFARFWYLRVGLAALLGFVALKLVLSDVVHIPSTLSLAIIVFILGTAGLASWLLPHRSRGAAAAASACSHLDQVQVEEPSGHACLQCVAAGDTWTHLRMCLTCGQVGCCDDSKNKHATAHFEATGHPLIRSIEKGESWRWCYVDRVDF
ncbi:MAG: TerC/Alx family metal homeostasis membrane protein [Burkholderiales bacterium]|nr:TerC/Alx family metal homeostasis membrane protein [Burkholderiales bacterium]